MKTRADALRERGLIPMPGDELILEYEIGDREPLPKRKLDIRPNAPIDNRSSFVPGRNAKR